MDHTPAVVSYSQDFVSLDQEVKDLTAPKPETRWCLLELPKDQLQALTSGSTFAFRELSGSEAGQGYAALSTADSTFRVEFLENSNTLLLGKVEELDKENAGPRSGGRVGGGSSRLCTDKALGTASDTEAAARIKSEEAKTSFREARVPSGAMWPTPSAPSAPLRAPPRTAAPRGAPCPHGAPRRRGEPSLRRWAPAVALAAGRHALRPIRRVALVGGTHGNELSGVYLVRSLMEHPLTHYDSLSLECLIGNPRAVDVCQRFVDTDLNRCFSKSALQSGASAAYEPRRAQEIDATLGPRFSEEACDLCIDLHNTTSNFGCGIIITNTSSPNLHWKLQLCCHLQSLRPDVHVVFDCVGDCAEEPFLPLLAKNDLTFEVGPQAHGTLLAEVFWKQKRLVLDTLDWLERYNRGELTEEERSPKELEATPSEWLSTDSTRRAESWGLLEPKKGA
ncbi:unnamed protein product [Effrenium voratum]|uniref:Succinylglutamate desuccinylase/Aspartoacylase catalytic domain-containing protein n=1 Tax=Effrenium voratum TaxID=2562239 RepID=A0AA36JJZ4_9DINO|nr:unnamed protein product [Effrenium voratum]